MRAKPRSAPWLCVAIALCLTACQPFSRPSTPPTPPRVSDCIEEPEGVYPDPPAFPAAGAPLTDRFLVELTSWNNQVLGIATTDRIRWRAERKCVEKMVEAGLVR